MPYPLHLLDANRDDIARINHDGSWSVRWPEVQEAAFQAAEGRHSALGAVCRLLVAARDNFIETSWAESDSWADQWTFTACTIGTAPLLPEPLLLLANFVAFGRYNLDGTWSVQWDWIERSSDHGDPIFKALRALLLAARDNFAETAWTPAPERPLFD